MPSRKPGRPSRKSPSKIKDVRVPKLRHHKPSKQGFVELNGHRHYLGVYGRPETEQNYHRTIAEWLANGRRVQVDPHQITVVEVIERFWTYIKQHYAKPNGEIGKEVDNYRSALKPINKIYGNTLASEFGPLALKTIRTEIAKSGIGRKYLNKQISRIKRMFRWAASEELIPAEVYHALSTVDGLRYGQDGMRESEPVRPVEQDRIDAIKPYVSQQVWALIQLQLLTGARSGELLPLRPIDLDMSGDVWLYRPAHHKTSHHGMQRCISFGQKAQVILSHWLSGHPIDRPIFSPAEAEQERRKQVHASRATSMSCGNRPGSNRQSKPKRKAGDQYSTTSYARAIGYACERAFPTPAKCTKDEKKAWNAQHRWTPHQLRHTTATRIRSEFGLEAGQVMLGHQHARVTEVYAERDLGKALEIARAVG